MIVLSGADLVRRDAVEAGATLVLEGDRIVDVAGGGAPGGHRADRVDLRGHLIVPGFVDVHVHGLNGVDTLDSRESVARIAGNLPRHGVTAFCPTTVACAPTALRDVLASVKALQQRPDPLGARVPGAHLESNFINASYRGAQPATFLRSPSSPDAGDVLNEIERAGAAVAIVTLAPELEGGLDLIARLAARGLRVSLGHSGASFEIAEAAIEAGARHATHLFNRMPPLGHRDPGLAAAVLRGGKSRLKSSATACTCMRPWFNWLSREGRGPRDGDQRRHGGGGTAGGQLRVPGQPPDLRSRRRRVPRRRHPGRQHRHDGHGVLVSREAVGFSLTTAVRLCSTTPAAELGLDGAGEIAPGALADLVVLDQNLAVRQTYIAGRLAYAAP